LFLNVHPQLLAIRQFPAKAKLPLNRIIVSSSCQKPDEISMILFWMAQENDRSISQGHGPLYDSLTKNNIIADIKEHKALFFYLDQELIAFTRLIDLGHGYWELGSAISSPQQRVKYTGFNTLFQASALLQLNRLFQSDHFPTLILIITYHIEVAYTIRRQMSPSKNKNILFKGAFFDFTRIRELSLANDHELIKILHLQDRSQNQDPFFVFDISCCLLRLIARGRKERIPTLIHQS